MRCDVAVIGAGPAGLTAARELARHGASVIVLDEYYRSGGRLLGQVYEDRRKPKGQRLWNGAALAAELERDVVAAGGVILTGRTVWDVQPGWRIHVAGGPEQEIDARAVIVATGAAERAIPIPGWTLPGVMTIGAAQVLTNVHAVAPGDRVLVVGMDPLSLSITGEMAVAGVQVVGVVLPPPGVLAADRAVPAAVIGGLAQASALAPNAMLRLGGRVFGGGLRGAAARIARLDVLRAWGVPLRLRTALVEITGNDKVEAACLQPIDARGRLTGAREIVSVDAVCISGGLYPLTDLIRLTGCAVAEVAELGGRVPIHGPALETRVPGLFVAGNVVGIEGAAVAAAQGGLAAAGALRYLGVASDPHAETAIADAQREVARARASLAFRFLPDVEKGHALVDVLWREGPSSLAIAPAPANAMPESDLLICRCEEVSVGTIVAAFDAGATAVPGVKKRTRACMGRCQGRVCEDAVRAIGEALGHPRLPAHRARLPVRPVRIGDL